MTTVPAPYNALHTRIIPSGLPYPDVFLDGPTHVACDWLEATGQDLGWKLWIDTHVLAPIDVVDTHADPHDLRDGVAAVAILRFRDPAIERDAVDVYEYQRVVWASLRSREKALASGDVLGFYAAHLGRLIGEQLDLHHFFESVGGGGLEVIDRALHPRLNDVSRLHDRLARTALAQVDWVRIARHFLVGGAASHWRIAPGDANGTRVLLVRTSDPIGDSRWSENWIERSPGNPDPHAAKLALATTREFRAEQWEINAFCKERGWAVELGGTDTDQTPFRVNPRPTAGQVDRFLAGFAPVATGSDATGSAVDGAFDRGPLLALCDLPPDAVSDGFDDANFAEYAMVVARDKGQSTASLAAAYINQALGSRIYDVQTSLPVRDGAVAA
jgi:hypothetical protein